MNKLFSQASIGRRSLLRGVAAAAVCASPLAWGEQADTRWRMVVNEGVNVDMSISMLATRYRDWAEYMANQIHNKQVMVEPIIDIRRFVQLAQSDQKPLLVYGKSVNQLSKLVRDYGYQPLVRRNEPYKSAFIVSKTSTVENLVQLGGKKILMPDEFSATVALAKAELRRMNVRDPFISHTRYQDTVASQIATGIAEAGVVSPTVARKWKEAGGRIIAETQPVVNWSVLASPKAPAEMVAKLTSSLLAMNSSAAEMLTDIGIKSWAKADKAEYLALLDYTGE
jgi:ABC-type phosphate/phosphonate transport system substrate-binding protein